MIGDFMRSTKKSEYNNLVTHCKTEVSLINVFTNFVK